MSIIIHSIRTKPMSVVTLPRADRFCIVHRKFSTFRKLEPTPLYSILAIRFLRRRRKWTFRLKNLRSVASVVHVNLRGDSTTFSSSKHSIATGGTMIFSVRIYSWRQQVSVSCFPQPKFSNHS